jgi:hypothetical protein
MLSGHSSRLLLRNPLQVPHQTKTCHNALLRDVTAVLRPPTTLTRALHPTNKNRKVKQRDFFHPLQSLSLDRDKPQITNVFASLVIVHCLFIFLCTNTCFFTPIRPLVNKVLAGEAWPY